MPHEPRTVASSAARTTAGVAPLSMRRDYGEQVSVMLLVTAVSGTTPTLDVEIRWSHDGATFASAEPADGFSQITAAKSTVKTFPVRAPFAQLSWTVGGTTPSFTFSALAYTTGC